MDEENNGYGGSSGSNLETTKAERSVWLMKCPLVVAKSWQNHPPSQPLSKVVLSLDPLLPEDDPSALQVGPPSIPILPLTSLKFDFVQFDLVFSYF